MANDIQYNEEIAWARLRNKVQQRHHSRYSRIKALLPWLVGLVAVLGVVAYAVSHQTRPLTLPDTVTIQPLTLADQVTPKAADFVQGLEGTGISVSFGRDYKESDILGTQDVSLVFTRDNETCTVTTQMYRFHLEPSVTVAQGEEMLLDIRDFVPDESIDAAFVTSLEEGACGIFDLQVACAGREYTVKCTVTENIPPQGTGREVTVEAGTVPDAAGFVENIQDHTPVTVTYKEDQSFVLAGKQTVTLVLTDLFGNTAEVEAIANVVPAADGPQFTGLSPIYLQVGASVSYKSGVKVTDAQDGDLTFTVEHSSFDNKTAGSYTVLYCAVDSDGNQLIMPRTIVVESHTGQAVREYAQAVLDEIIKPDMTRDEQIYAVFKRVWHYVWYSGKSDKSSVENAAYEGFSKWSGDCYTYYAMVRVMLDLLEIPNLEVTRVGGDSHHWWNLVQFEDGKYYHVDATPHRYTTMEHFKMTESTIIEYTNTPKIANYRPNYYTYDTTLPEYQNIEIAQ